MDPEQWSMEFVQEFAFVLGDLGIVEGGYVMFQFTGYLGTIL